jgi:hypothetical protein
MEFYNSILRHNLIHKEILSMSGSEFYTLYKIKIHVVNLHSVT